MDSSKLGVADAGFPWPGFLDWMGLGAVVISRQRSAVSWLESGSSFDVRLVCLPCSYVI